MNRKQRRAEAKSRVVPGDPGPPGERADPSASVAALFAAALHHYQAGQRAEADAFCQRLLAVDPKNIDGLHLSGVIAFHDGHYDDAIDMIGGAISRLDRVVPHPSLAETHRNLAGALHNNLGIALKSRGDMAEAIRSYERALAINPHAADAANNLGIALRSQGRLEEAIRSYERALALNPSFVEAHNNLGCVLQDQGRLSEAMPYYRHALTLRPAYEQARKNLINAAIACGEAATAFAAIKEGLAVQPTDENKALFVQWAKAFPFAPDAEDTRGLVLQALSAPWGPPTDLMAMAAGLVKRNPEIADSIQCAVRVWPNRPGAQELLGPSGFAVLSNDPLLLCLLEAAPVSDIELEQFLGAARFAMLEIAMRSTTSQSTAPQLIDDKVLRFLCALAGQCFINEYAYACAGDEAVEAEKLRDSVIAALDSGAPVPVLWVAAVAAYFPLHALSAGRLLERAWPPALDALLTRQIREPREELLLRAAIPRLTTVENDVSLRVREQYEENPYPRWVKIVPINSYKGVDSFLHDTFPTASFQRLGEGNGIDILVAGCGTGQHPIATARKFPGARILAVDLSEASLGYAKRKSLEVGLDHIQYAQADILQLGSIGRTFDVIEAIGVLHHLADPMEAWRILLSLLRPNGLMHIGLYSELARRPIVDARAFIANREYGRTAHDIRRGRRELMVLKDTPWAQSIQQSADFFSLSACRDLLFHVEEHRLTLPEIRDFLGDNHLNLIGFETGATIKQKYNSRFPVDAACVDLDRWHEFEVENPTTFAGMYQFWVQKRE